MVAYITHITIIFSCLGARSEKMVAARLLGAWPTTESPLRFRVSLQQFGLEVGGRGMGKHDSRH